jgi:predicted Zn-dependent protease
MRERVRVLSGDAAKLATYYGSSLAKHPEFDTPANRYGYALALARSGAAPDAVRELRKLVEAQPASAPLRLALAGAEDQAGDKAASLARFEQLAREFPGNRAITLTFADALLARADGASARRALELLRPLVERYAEDPTCSAVSAGPTSSPATRSVPPKPMPRRPG